MEAGISKDPYLYSGLALAYIGDSALDLYVKDYFVRRYETQTEKYHKEVTAIVKAVNQAAFADTIMDSLSERETDIFKRGRNAQPHSKAKNATRSEYRRATGLEALFGYLYLAGEKERFNELADAMIAQYLAKED